jgi:hypothetical protein
VQGVQPSSYRKGVRDVRAVEPSSKYSRDSGADQASSDLGLGLARGSKMKSARVAPRRFSNRLKTTTKTTAIYQNDDVKEGPKTTDDSQNNVQI